MKSLVRVTCMSAVASILTASPSSAQSPYGSVEFRWRERALGVLPVINGRQTADLPTGAASISGNGTTSPNSATDARFCLILEARVTRAAGNTDLRGLAGVQFDMLSSDLRTQGTFAGVPATSGSLSYIGNAASASTAVATSTAGGDPGLVLRPGSTSLPGTDNQGDRGIFAPFRRLADLGGKNSPSAGVKDESPWAAPNTSSMSRIVPYISSDVFQQRDPDTNAPGPYFNRFEYAGLNSWAPLISLVYNVTDVTTPRTIILDPVVQGVSALDTGLRGFRYQLTGAGIDSWMLDNAGVPKFAIVVPAPSAAVIAAIGLVTVGRRRR